MYYGRYWFDEENEFKYTLMYLNKYNLNVKLINASNLFLKN